MSKDIDSHGCILRKLGLSSSYLILCNGLCHGHHLVTRITTKSRTPRSGCRCTCILCPDFCILHAHAHMHVSLVWCLADSGDMEGHGERIQSSEPRARTCSTHVNYSCEERKESTGGCRPPPHRTCEPSPLKVRDYRPSTHALSTLAEKH